MLKKFMLKNYKNFKDEITIDFENIAGYQFNTDCLSDGIIGKMLIYGRNATGKTNLGRAILEYWFNNVWRNKICEVMEFYSTRIPKKMRQCFNMNFIFEDTELSYKY